TERAVVTINQTEELLQDKSTDQELHSIAVEELQAAKDAFEEHFNLTLIPLFQFDVVIHGKDLKIDTFRSRGAGGQSVNKTDSAVRITHLPTGTVVECQRERNQYRNKSLALARLRSLLYQREKDKEIDASTASRRLQVGTRGRSEKIRTYNFPQDRVTDHRIGLSIHDVNGVLSGGEVFQHLLDELKEFAHRENLQTLLMSDPLANIIASVNKK
ncbi:peptide chain release factor 1-like, mitochondrial, partial [Hyalella azteca]|uniref:Peptide chain release factor 1-like, mitochondrial n=1 Tax=Hyalella azteca TaxID=294128 RepID=A0A979FJ33_HYAAZ